ncbi:MAG: AAA family ATPase [Clostridia bacterium]|nr:AAA family ATPase [Clostridia bacterium]
MILSEENQYIKSIEIDWQKVHAAKLGKTYPFNLPIIKQLSTLSCHPQVTYLIGENGVGKSTLIEAIATAYGFNPEGGTKNMHFSTEASHSVLHDFLRISKSYRQAKDGFFLRAETVYNVSSHIDQLDREGGFGPPIIASYGGVSLHKQSHGESFFAIFMNRFSGKGIYILDEPEAALSPTRQMAMLKRMDELIKEGSQFIIATHSPIILAYPQSRIYEITEKTIEVVNYKETEHYAITKTFLDDPEHMLKLLL